MALGLLRTRGGGVDGGLGPSIHGALLGPTLLAALGMDELELAPPSGGVHLGHLLGGSSITFLPFWRLPGIRLGHLPPSHPGGIILGRLLGGSCVASLLSRPLPGSFSNLGRPLPSGFILILALV